jgi:8-oxo-dGTP diphosphatase
VATILRKFPSLTVDPLVFCFHEQQLKVLLYRRSEEPFQGELAIPGGFSFADETTIQALKRALENKTPLKLGKLSYIEQMHFFDDNVDPRGHAVSLTYLCLIRPNDVPDTAYLTSAHQLPKLAFAHNKIVERGLEELKRLLLTTTIASSVLDREFSLNDLHRLYQAALNQQLDNRNFRSKFLRFNVLTDTNKREENVAYRPGKLYRFTQSAVQSLGELKL